MAVIEITQFDCYTWYRYARQNDSADLQRSRKKFAVVTSATSTPQS